MKTSTTFTAFTVAFSICSATRIPSLVKRDQLVINCDPSSERDCESELQDYFNAVCFPLNGTKNGYDFNAPCPATQAITKQCIFGDVGLSNLPTPDDSYGYSNVMRPLSNETQRNCICGSQYFTLLEGCESCLMKHGMEQLWSEGQVIPANIISSVSRSYCAASATPTVDFSNFIYSVAFSSELASSSVSSSASMTSSLVAVTDPIGNRTDVSLYFTPSATLTSAWYIPNPTASPVVSSGQIIAASAAVSGTNATNTHNAGVRPTAVVAGGAFIALAAGFVAAL